DVIGAGSASSEAELFELYQGVDRVPRLDLANLKVGPRGAVGIPAAPVAGNLGQPAQLGTRQSTSRDAATEHECVLGRRDMEKAVELVAKSIGGIRKPPSGGIGHHCVPYVEAVAFMFDAFFLAEVFDRCPEERFGAALNCSGGIGGELPPIVPAQPRHASLCPKCRKEAFKILFLFIGE